MAAFDYAKSHTTALRLIQRFGQTGKVRKLTPGSGPAYNPGPSIPTDHDATMVVLEYSNHDRQGTLIQANDKRVYIAAKGLAPEVVADDKIVEADGTVWTVVASRPLKPAGLVVFWDVQVRR